MYQVNLHACFCGASVKGVAQLISNPSFEGQARTGAPPSPWTTCNTFSSPDTQPGSWEVTRGASHGNTYLGLVTRGNLGPFANNNEAAGIPLNFKLTAGYTYVLNLDLAFSNTLGHSDDMGNFLSYANPVVLKIWGGTEKCEKKELLWESQPISHLDWRTYEVKFLPKTHQLTHIILEADYLALPSYFGNILIDNIVEVSIPIPPVGKCGIQTFNVFTPNGDGLNDEFIFRPTSNVVKFNLKVFNRWGKLVYETNDLTKGWDGYINGSKGSTGVYYWYTAFMCIEDNQIYDNSMKGHVTLLE